MRWTLPPTIFPQSFCFQEQNPAEKNPSLSLPTHSAEGPLPPKLSLEDTALLSTCLGQNCHFLPMLPKEAPLMICPLATYLSERNELALSLAFYFSPLVFKMDFFLKPEGCPKMFLLRTQQQDHQLREYEASLSHCPKRGNVKFITNDKNQTR